MNVWKTKSRKRKPRRVECCNYCRQLACIWRNFNIKILLWNPYLQNIWQFEVTLGSLTSCYHFLCASLRTSSYSLILYGAFIFVTCSHLFLITDTTVLEFWRGTWHFSLMSTNLLMHVLQIHCLMSLSANLSEIGWFSSDLFDP